MVEQGSARAVVEQGKAVEDGAGHIGDRQPADGAAPGAGSVRAEHPQPGDGRRAHTVHRHRQVHYRRLIDRHLPQVGRSEMAYDTLWLPEVGGMCPGGQRRGTGGVDAMQDPRSRPRRT